jgi:hypothetical protein
VEFFARVETLQKKHDRFMATQSRRAALRAALPRAPRCNPDRRRALVLSIKIASREFAQDQYRKLRKQLLHTAAGRVHLARVSAVVDAALAAAGAFSTAHVTRAMGDGEALTRVALTILDQQGFIYGSSGFRHGFPTFWTGTR